MKNNRRVAMFLAMLGLLSAVHAETVYVAERIPVNLRAEAAETGTVLKTVESGAPLKVLQRSDRYVQVRDR